MWGCISHLRMGVHRMDGESTVDHRAAFRILPVTRTSGSCLPFNCRDSSAWRRYNGKSTLWNRAGGKARRFLRPVYYQYLDHDWYTVDTDIIIDRRSTKFQVGCALYNIAIEMFPTSSYVDKT